MRQSTLIQLMKSVAIDLKHVVHNDLTGQRRVIPRDTRYITSENNLPSQ